MIGYLAFRAVRGTGRAYKQAGREFRQAPIRDKFWVFVIVTVFTLLIGNWVGAAVAAMLAGFCWLLESGRRIQAEAKRQARVDQDRLDDARACANRKGIPHQSVYASK